jgi:DNA-binding NarL/FixJ family response regulator
MLHRVDTLALVLQGVVSGRGRAGRTQQAVWSCMSQLKVFLVEDSPVIRQNLVGALEEMAPVTVVGHAESAAAATALLSGQPPPCDLAIVDVFLRAGIGLDVLRALREQHSPVARVVLTNYATPDIRSQCLALRADRVFDKSGDIDALVDYCIELAPKSAGSGAA